MASKKIRDLVVKVGEYQDRNTGANKGRFENIGALMESDKDGSYFIMLKRTFNPAGVPGQDARESILISCYLPEDQRKGDGGQSQQPRAQSGSPAGGAGRGGTPDMDDEIPFAPEWRG